MRLSSELQSQTINKYVISQVLDKTKRTKWRNKFNEHDLVIESWANGVWCKQVGLISYADLATYLRQESQMKAEKLSVMKTENEFVVTSYQGGDKAYLVKFKNASGWRCNCLRYRCWRRRLHEEMPKLLQHFNGKVFCHHILAVYNRYSKSSK
jgi:hypothetical protein